MPELLFIYGTLHPDRAPREIAAAARRLEFAGRGTIRARVYNLGAYPGAVLDSTAEPISGVIFRVPDAAMLIALDAYEDYRPDDVVGSLFRRTETPVTLDDGSQKVCWIYVYNGPPQP